MKTPKPKKLIAWAVVWEDGDMTWQRGNPAIYQTKAEATARIGSVMCKLIKVLITPIK